MAEAEKVARRLAGQVDERRHPRTNATVDHLLDRHFELVTLERSTLATYLGYVEKHLRPLIGHIQVGALDADLFDSFDVELRRCREHCTGDRFVEHRTPVAHECDGRCRPHACRPLGASTIRQVHVIFSGTLKRGAVALDRDEPDQLGRTATGAQAEPHPPAAGEAAKILAAAWVDPEWARSYGWRSLLYENNRLGAASRRGHGRDDRAGTAAGPWRTGLAAGIRRKGARPQGLKWTPTDRVGVG